MLSFEIFTGLIDLKISSNFHTIALKISKSEDTSITLYNQEESVHSIFDVIKLFCIAYNFEKVYDNECLLGEGSYGKVILYFFYAIRL